ncbi:hypothetical protein LCGC14_3076210 [marine sediment metagenome]|uniref:Uncharacterized protein n=1 Tax=marine sediment metagenome TaxID=412755 RepID=A0A0F8Z5B0_9ZZZZ
MAKRKRTVKKDKLQNVPKTVKIPLTLLRHLVRLTGNRQAKSYLRIATGKTYVTNQPGENVVEPEVAKAEKKDETITYKFNGESLFLDFEKMIRIY